MWIPKTPAGLRDRTGGGALSYKDGEMPVQGMGVSAGSLPSGRDGALPDSWRGSGRMRRGGGDGARFIGGWHSVRPGGRGCNVRWRRLGVAGVGA